ncbi:MAG: helix-turn-helix transcriptional regulator [Bacilli bacterium]|nr:helix-turn-helix transcriptional regulator [Bacilli bacterium]
MDLNKVGNFIVMLRKEKNLTQLQLAELIGASDKTVSKWEKGNGFPDIAYQTKLCSVLDIFLEELHDGEYNLERRKRHKRRKIINRMIAIYAAITIPLIIFLCLFFINNYDSTKIYLLETKNSSVEVNVHGTLVETNQTSMLYISNIDIWNYNIKETDIISVEIYSDKTLIYHTNELSNIVVKYADDINQDKIMVKVTITNNKKEDTVYEVKLASTNISKDNEIKSPRVSKLHLLTEEEIVANLKKAGFKKDGDNWKLNKKNNKLEEIVSYYSNANKITYNSTDSIIIKNITFNLKTNLLIVCVYNKSGTERILFEKYIYDYNDGSLDCQVGVCSTVESVCKTLEEYITLLIVE